MWSFTIGNYDYAMRLVTTEDLDGDGKRDVAVGSWSRGLPVVSGADGTLIWRSWAGSLNGGDFWTVDTVGDLDDRAVGGPEPDRVIEEAVAREAGSIGVAIVKQKVCVSLTGNCGILNETAPNC